MAANHHTHHGNARDNGISPTSSIAQFTKGVAVKIVGTDNVLQRVPHLVGCIGTVREVPVHPNTWFKIEFSDGKASLPSYKSKSLTTTFSLISMHCDGACLYFSCFLTSSFRFLTL